MHFSALAIAMFAAGAFASPINRRDDVVVDTVVDDVVVTDVVMVTVTEGQAPPSPVAQAAEPVVNVVTTTTSPPAVAQQHYYEPAPPPPPPSPVAAQVQTQSIVAAPPSPYVASPVVPSATQAPSTSAAPQPSSNPSSGSQKGFVANLDTGSQQYQQLALDHHNVHRANHSATDLVWNSTLADYAKTTAETCVYDHSLTPGGGGYGQNIANGIAPGNISSIITNGLYNDEFGWYGNQWGKDNPNMQDFEKWGHLSQIVWKSTTSVGCYTSSCAPPGADPQLCKPGTNEPYLANTVCGTNPGTPAFFTVCNYYPAGNVQGQYSNVQAPKNNNFVEITETGVIGM